MIFINDFSRKFEIDLYNLCENSPYGARIISYHTAYHGKKYDFLDFWVQRDNENNAAAALCKYYSTLIICGNSCDITEVEEFVSMISPDSILCGIEMNLNCEMKLSIGETMACTKLNNIHCGLSTEYKISKLNSNMRSLKEVYSLLVKENSQSRFLPDFESYFLDISHRIRHGVSKVYVITNDLGKIVSTATIIAISRTSSVIGSVATASESRNNGLATALVKHITEKELLQNRTVYLHREKNITLYEKIGFNTVSLFYSYNLNLPPQKQDQIFIRPNKIEKEN